MRDFAGARYGGEIGPDTQFRIYGKFFDRTDEVLGDGSDASDAWHQGRAGFRIDSASAPRDRLTLQGDVYDSHEHALSSSVANSSGANLLGRWTRTLSDESDFSLQSYIDRTHLADPVAPLMVSGLQFSPAGHLL